MNLGKIVRAAVGVVAVIAIGVVVMNYYNDYKAAAVRAAKAAAETTQTAGTVPTSTVSGPAVVQITGVNFRKKPSSSAKRIRELKAGEKLTVLRQDGQWYEVTDSKGTTGWVTAVGGYVVLKGQ